MEQSRIDEAKLIQGWVKLALSLVILASYAAGIGYNLSRVNENERRIGVLETQMQNTVGKDDVRQQLTDIKDQLDKMDIRLNQMDERLDRMLLRNQPSSQITTFSDRKH